MPTINHFSCYSINSLRHVRMRKETEQERDAERKRERGERVSRACCFSFIFYPDDKSRRIPWHAGRFSGKNSWRLTRDRFARLAFLCIRVSRRGLSPGNDDDDVGRMHLRKYTNEPATPLVTHPPDDIPSGIYGSYSIEFGCEVKCFLFIFLLYLFACALLANK